MSASGSIDMRCEKRGERSRLPSIRCTGLSRTSRGFAEDDGAVRLVVSILGPGVLSGDRFELRGDVAAGGALVVAGQMATPVFAGVAESETHSTWTVADGALLCALNEPLLLEAGSSHAAHTSIDLEPGAVAIVTDTIAFRGPARLTSRTVARVDGRPVIRDAMELSGPSRDGAIGTVIVVSDDAGFRAAVAAASRRLSIAFGCGGRVGWGETSAAAIVRIAGPVWDVQRLTVAIAAAARLARQQRACLRPASSAA